MSQLELDKIYEILDSNVEYANQVARQTVENYTKDLDELMRNIYSEIVSVEDPATSSIEKYFMALSNCLYFIGEDLEKIGIYDDLSKAQAKEKYNSAYMDSVNPVDAKKKITVAEAQTAAENASTYENMVNTIYARSYKIFKYKVDAAQTMLSSLSKMLSKRMQDSQLTLKDVPLEVTKKWLAESGM